MTAVDAFEVAARHFEPPPAGRYLHDPAGWARDVIDWPEGKGLTAYQEEILELLPVKRRVAVRGPHGLGKTAVDALVVLWFATTRDAARIDWKVITTASAWRHLSVFLFPEIHKWARLIRWDVLGRPPFDRTELLTLNLKLAFGAASAVASNKPELIEGAHADSLLYLIDEAKIVPNATWDAIEGAFSGGQPDGLPEAFALANSTPGPPAGRFYDIHKRGRGLEDWHVRHVTLAEAVKAGRISPDWAEQRRLQWGADSALYANRVLGEFHASDEDAVIPLAWAEAAVDRWHAWNDAGRPALDGRRIVGVDVARGGADATVLAHRTGVCVERLEDHSSEDTMRTTARVVPYTSDGVTAVVDSIGVGGGVVDRLRELKQTVLPYTGSAKTSAKDRTGEHGFSNTRSGAYWHLRELLDPAFDPEVMLPPDDLLLADLTTPTWSEVSGVPPKIKVEAKDDVVARLGRSPDRGDACLAAGTLVATEWGDIPIQHVRPGMRVWTRSGLRPVLAAGLTGRDQPLLRAELEDGRTVTGTPSHPVWDGSHFRRLDAFVKADSMWVCKPNGLLTKESPSLDTPNPRTAPTGFTSGRIDTGATKAQAPFTLRSTSLKSDPFPPDGTFITETTTPWITDPKTLRRSLTASTRLTTSRPTAGGDASTLSTWIECGTLPKSGTGRPRGWPGTPSKVGEAGQADRRNRLGPATGAAPRSSRSDLTLRGDVGAPVDAMSRGSIAPAHTESTRHALSADPCFLASASEGPRIAPVRVRRLCVSGIGDVWNLAVEDAPEFFANGILVHNCVMAFWADALRRDAVVSSPRGAMPATGLSPLAGGAGGRSGLSPLG